MVLSGYVTGPVSTVYNTFHLIGWNSKPTARSTPAAETLALKDAVDNAFFLISTILREEMGLIAFNDRKQLHDSLKSSKGVTEKR